MAHRKFAGRTGFRRQRAPTAWINGGWRTAPEAFSPGAGTTTIAVAINATDFAETYGRGKFNVRRVVGSVDVWGDPTNTVVNANPPVFWTCWAKLKADAISGLTETFTLSDISTPGREDIMHIQGPYFIPEALVNGVSWDFKCNRRFEQNEVLTHILAFFIPVGNVGTWRALRGSRVLVQGV